MGWNDRFDPDEYDASDPDSMRRLADRARTKPRKPTAAEQEWLDSLTVGSCEYCPRDNVKLVNGYLCAGCYRLDKYGY